MSSSVFSLLVLAFLSALASGQLQLWNPQAHDNSGSTATIPGYYDDWIIFDRINWDPVNAPWFDRNLPLIQRNVSSLTLRNVGTTNITLTAFHVRESSWFIVLPEYVAQLPHVIPPGLAWEIKIQFIFSGGPPSSKITQLEMHTDFVDQSIINVTLAGAYAPVPEGPSEVILADIIRVSGWQTNLEEFKPTVFLNWPHLSENITDPPRGDEHRAQYWMAADPSKPVYVRQAAAYQFCCSGGATLELLSQATGTTLLRMNQQEPRNGQSMLPARIGGDPQQWNEAIVTVTEPFVVVIDGYRSDAPRWLGMHFYAIRGRDGEIIPNTYVIPMDYSTPYYFGCLDPYVYPGHGNCDFQDNVFYMTNIVPVGTVLTAPPPRASTTSPTSTVATASATEAIVETTSTTIASTTSSSSTSTLSASSITSASSRSTSTVTTTGLSSDQDLSQPTSFATSLVISSVATLTLALMAMLS